MSVWRFMRKVFRNRANGPSQVPDVVSTCLASTNSADREPLTRFHYFLSLPRELRDMIYEFYILDLEKYRRFTVRRTEEVESVPLPPLGFTNSQISREIYPILLQNTRVTLAACDSGILSTLLHKRLGSIAFSNIRRLDIDIPSMHMWKEPTEDSVDIFAQQHGRSDNPYYYDVRGEDLVEFCTGLKELTLRFHWECFVEASDESKCSHRQGRFYPQYTEEEMLSLVTTDTIFKAKNLRQLTVKCTFPEKGPKRPIVEGTREELYAPLVNWLEKEHRERRPDVALAVDCRVIPEGELWFAGR